MELKQNSLILFWYLSIKQNKNQFSPYSSYPLAKTDRFADIGYNDKLAVSQAMCRGVDTLSQTNKHNHAANRQYNLSSWTTSKQLIKEKFQLTKTSTSSYSKLFMLAVLFASWIVFFMSLIIWLVQWSTSVLHESHFVHWFKFSSRRFCCCCCDDLLPLIAWLRKLEHGYCSVISLVSQFNARWSALEMWC